MMVELGASGIDCLGFAVVEVGLCVWACGWVWVSVWIWVGCASWGIRSTVDWHKAIAGGRRTNKAKAVRLFLNRVGSSHAGKTII
jgi:hypothetical protein